MSTAEGYGKWEVYKAYIGTVEDDIANNTSRLHYSNSTYKHQNWNYQLPHFPVCEGIEKQKYLKGLGHHYLAMKLKKNHAPWGDGKLEFVWFEDHDKGTNNQQFLHVEDCSFLLASGFP